MKRQRSQLVKDGLAAVKEWEQDHGPFSDSELQSARSRVADEMGARKRSRPRK